MLQITLLFIFGNALELDYSCNTLIDYPYTDKAIELCIEEATSYYNIGVNDVEALAVINPYYKFENELSDLVITDINDFVF